MKRILFVLVITVIALSCLTAQNQYTLSSHSMKVKGTSSLHDWTVNSADASGKGVIVFDGGKVKDVKSLNLEIAGLGLKSEKQSDKMDKKMQEALNVLVYPKIKYELKKVTALPSEKNDHTLSAIGTLTIAGVSREESLLVRTKTDANGAITFAGEKKLLMTDFGVKPPKAMMGMITTGNEITVDFEIVMSKN
jgi:polyisoprenoid-binding protein YceI